MIYRMFSPTCAIVVTLICLIFSSSTNNIHVSYFTVTDAFTVTPSSSSSLRTKTSIAITTHIKNGCRWYKSWVSFEKSTLSSQLLLTSKQQQQQLVPSLLTRLYLSSTDDDTDDDIVFEEEELIDDDEEEGEEENTEEDDFLDDDDDDEEIMNSVVDNDDEEDEDDFDEGIEEEDGLESLVLAGGEITNVENDNFNDYGTTSYDEGIEWDVNEDGIDYELIDDMEDPDYVQQKELVDMAVRESELRIQNENFDPLQFLTDQLTPETSAQLDQMPFFQQVEELAQGVTLTDDDMMQSGITDDNFPTIVDTVSDLIEDDPYPRHSDESSNYLQQASGITDDDMIELDETYKSVQAALNKEPWDKVMLRAQQGFDDLSNQTLNEIDECLGEIGGSAYNVTNWLLYDLDFNVSNLMLAAIQHNKHAPILFQHWYPQLVVYKRYQHARDRNFDFTWEDVENADITELERYYAGFGYDEIPSKAPAETGIINLDDLDEEDIKMAAFENWMTDVYNPEMDRKDFDDDTMRDEDNVFSDFYQYPQHPDLPSMEDAVDDIEQFQYENIGIDNANKYADVKEYRDMMGQTFDYEVVRDEEFLRDFRGHVIIACTGDDADLEIAERITLRFQQEFGKQVYVETRVMALAREEDNVYEIWIESYDIELLHSKKRAMANIKGWTGPAEIDDAQIDFLTNRVRFLISDDARYSYRMELDLAD